MVVGQIMLDSIYMARKPRIHLPDGFYYVTLRGNGDKNIFLSVEDSKYFEDLIAENIVKYGCEVHAYCWIKNQAYILVRIGNTPLTKIIHNISFRYSLYFNKIHNQNGHLFNGRYKACLTDPEKYLLTIVRYIHLVPYLAGIVSKPHEYKWSSHRAYLERTNCNWLTRDYVLSLFSNDNDYAKQFYYEFMNKGMSSENIYQLQDTKDTRIFGDDDFVQEVLGYHNDQSKKIGLNTIIREVCRRFDADLNEITSKSRSRRLSRIRTIIGYFVMEYGDITLSDYGRLVNRDVSTLSGAITNYRKLLKMDNKNQYLVNELKDAIGIR